MKRVREIGGRNYRLPATLGLGLVLLLLPACESMLSRGGQSEGRMAASAVRDPVLQDIPKPSGFVLAADRSVAISSGKLRLAKCEYTGALTPAAVKRFYDEYMPSANFELRRWSLDGGVFSMYFESSSELCTIRARPTDRKKTTVLVEIAPKPQGSTERESPPPMRRPQ